MLLILVAVAGCSTIGGPDSSTDRGSTASASVTTLVVGWEHYFKLAWEVEPEAGDRRTITGYVFNEYGRSAVQVQILAQALDPAGQLIDQRLVRLPGDVPALSRGYFKVQHLPAADRYRVTVWAFMFQGGGA